jgi:two-component system CheB/CheR fusion protein
MSNTSDSADSADRIIPPALSNGDHDFFVVGIGASAGGIKALKEFFAKVPADSGMAYVVILHLSPEHESYLAGILQTAASIPVAQIDQKVHVKPNHVYVIPPNKSLSMADGHLLLSDIINIETRRAPVDIFFRTLADARNSRSISVILSGTGADGSMGIKRVKEMGGTVIVQDPSEAEYSDMPRNSIATNLVDYVLPVAEIPGKILAYRKNAENTPLLTNESDLVEEAEQALRDIFTQLRVKTGHDFSNYKRGTVLRRIARRITLHELPDLKPYAAFLHQNAEEARSLLKDLLISVTNFFRDQEPFQALEQNIIPKLFEGKKSDDVIRIWVAGCATGEEAYSIAMLLTEKTLELPMVPSIQIFATDIDEDAIAHAREGCYTLNDAADVSPERLRRFFVKEGDAYRVRREIREMILFAVHNVVKDPPFSRLDLVSCRNLLIYLNRAAQERVLSIFHFALNPGCYLFLGNSESTDQAGDLYLTVDKEGHIFQGRPMAPSMTYPVPDLIRPVRLDQTRSPLQQQETRALERLSYIDLHQQLLEQYAPPSLVVNSDYDIVHISESAGAYLQLGGGEPSHNLLKVARRELRLELRTALFQAVQKRTNVQTRGIEVKNGHGTETVSIIVRPVLRESDSASGFVLIIFQKLETAQNDGETKTEVLTDEPIAAQLEEELTQLKTQLRVTIEQYEVQNEELKASNEELQAINEELRSTAEELETSKEELQSVNEELVTVNQELKIKIEEISQSNNDLQNLISSTDIGTIFLDRAFRIKLFTPKACAIFNLIPADLGRNLSDITGELEYGQLMSDVEGVLLTLQPVRRQVSTGDGREYLMSILPYRTADDRISGVILTFVDVSEQIAAEDKLSLSEHRIRLLTESFRDYAIITTDLEGLIRTWNPGAESTFGFKEEEALGHSAEIIFTPEDIANGIPEQEMTTAREKGRAEDERWHQRKDGSRFYVSGVMSALYDDRKLIGYAKIARDLTRQMETEEELRNAREQLEARVESRTAELARANEFLKDEIHERKNSEEQRVGLLRRIVTTQEDERRRIARDLHDHLGQRLTALRLKIASLKEVCGDNDELCARVDRLGEIAARLDAEVSFLAWELRPTALDDLGLEAAIGNFTREWSQHFEIAADFHSAGLTDKRLDSEVETNLYRISQEALNNIFKHAKASNVSVLLELRKNNVVLIVEDNGQGFDPKEESIIRASGKGLGLIGMRERANLVGGSLEIESAPGQGTAIFALVPAQFLEENGNNDR